MHCSVSNDQYTFISCIQQIINDHHTAIVAAINRCSGRVRPCDPNALCIFTGPAMFECSCINGYEGDGFLCIPINPCQTNSGDCPSDSTRCEHTGPGQVRRIFLSVIQLLLMFLTSTCRLHPNSSVAGKLETRDYAFLIQLTDRY